MASQRRDTALAGTGAAAPLVWARTACAICGRPANLRRTLRIALVVGILLTLINQLDVFIRGGATALTWVKMGLNFLVPFCVSNLGLLAGARTAPGAAEEHESEPERSRPASKEL